MSTSHALMENAFRLSSVIDSSHDSLILFDANGRIYYMSAQAQQLFGYGPGAYLHLDVRSLFVDVPETASPPLPLTQSPEQRFSSPREYVAVHHSGSRLPVDISVSQTELEPERIGYIAMIRDLSQTRRREVEFRQFRQAVEQSPVSVVITDLTGQIEYVNPKFTEVTGYTSSEVIGKNPRLLNSGKTPPETYTSMWAALRNGNTWTGDFINKKKNGDSYYEAASISTVRDHHGKPLFYVAVKEDVTQQRLAEEALRESQRFIRSTLDSLVDQVAIFDVEGMLLDANASWRQHHPAPEPGRRITLDACLGEAFTEDQPRQLARQAAHDIAARRRERFASEVVLGTPARWYRLELSPFQGDGPMRLIFTLHDIDTQQQAMRALVKARDEAE
ncbi:MAG TPA: PAS domain S-box protein, partial [Candidatus Ozemobacteraceae bacterium]|nr:PAS domain S-box protein [Candidatus Ozemobacteraceae bacterium]